MDSKGLGANRLRVEVTDQGTFTREEYDRSIAALRAAAVQTTEIGAHRNGTEQPPGEHGAT